MENTKTNHTSRDVEFVIRKKELKQEYWPRLLKESKKVHFLKTNFDKVSACHPKLGLLMRFADQDLSVG